MREFILENQLGEAYRLNSDEYFLHDPQGLGFTKDIKYSQYGTKYEVLSESHGARTFQGSIAFDDSREISAYERFTAFSLFLQHTPLVLYYKPDEEYKIDVMPEEVEKTELGDWGLDVTVHLRALSLFYKEIETINPYTMGNSVEGYQAIWIYSDSIEKCGCCFSITFDAAFTLSKWEQWIESPYGNKKTMEGGFSSSQSFSAGETLEIHSDTNPYKIVKLTPGQNGAVTATDLYSYSDFSKARFPLLEFGNNTFRVYGSYADPEDPLTLSLALKGRLEYATV